MLSWTRMTSTRACRPPSSRFHPASRWAIRGFVRLTPGTLVPLCEPLAPRLAPGRPGSPAAQRRYSEAPQSCHTKGPIPCSIPWPTLRHAVQVAKPRSLQRPNSGEDAGLVRARRTACTGLHEYETRCLRSWAAVSRSDTAYRSWSPPTRRRNAGNNPATPIPAFGRTQGESAGGCGNHNQPLLSGRVWQDFLSACAARMEPPDAWRHVAPPPEHVTTPAPGAPTARRWIATPQLPVVAERFPQPPIPCSQITAKLNLGKYLS